MDQQVFFALKSYKLFAKCSYFTTARRSCRVGDMENSLTKDDQQEIELYKSVISFVQQSINMCFLLNGGAMISLLTFLGNLSDAKTASFQQDIRISGYYFAFGTISSAISAVFCYMTQFTYYKEKISGERPFFLDGTVMRVLLLIGILTSIVLFARGSLIGVLAVSQI